jgi:hypothetical protein
MQHEKNSMLFHAVPCSMKKNSMLFHAVPCSSMLFHAVSMKPQTSATEQSTHCHARKYLEAAVLLASLKVQTIVYDIFSQLTAKRETTC